MSHSVENCLVNLKRTLVPVLDCLMAFKKSRVLFKEAVTPVAEKCSARCWVSFLKVLFLFAFSPRYPSHPHPPPPRISSPLPPLPNPPVSLPSSQPPPTLHTLTPHTPHPPHPHTPLPQPSLCPSPPFLGASEKSVSK